MAVRTSDSTKRFHDWFFSLNTKPIINSRRMKQEELVAQLEKEKCLQNFR
jgi:hypothetical protein